MPRGDGTGPAGQGQGYGRGQGRGQKRGKGFGKGNRPGAGIGGFCVCPSCGEKVPHQRGILCHSINCPKCNAAMVRG